jgi:hypothetical protein
VEIDDILEEDLLSIFNVFEVNNSTNKQTVKKASVKESLGEVFIEENFNDKVENQATQKSVGKVLEIDSQNVESFALLLKELLNNKTIEISIKIKEN